MSVPPRLPSGSYRLDLDVAPSDLPKASSGSPRPVVLDTVQVTSRPRRFSIPATSRKSGAVFGHELTLVGYDIGSGPPKGKEPISVKVGNQLAVNLVWQASPSLGPNGIPRNDKVFVQLLNSAGKLVAQNDSVPAGGAAPTTTWAPGEVVVDRHVLSLPRNLSPGTYTLIAGLYDEQTLVRLPTGASDHVVLGHVTVTK